MRIAIIDKEGRDRLLAVGDMGATAGWFAAGFLLGVALALLGV